ncbi:transmembrane protein 174 isoform X1 [Thunnus albacares]|uniref:transmembrane protein 174 isoform X1 n=1 Tax=Thunnus albacares TaxID=8236 RepID=UPI001CF6F39A|nr:transmembrane protein 174 isoform X1 [Thunnus albacares]
MDQQGPQGVWTHMLGQWPIVDTNCARNPTVVLNGPPDHLPPAPHPRQSDSLLDGEKTGATLLFSGVFLALMGVIFTTMGWQQYQVNLSFEWPQLLGPILISVGGTFVFTSVCKFGIVSCCRCRQWDEEVLVMPVMEQTSFTLRGTNQPIVLRGGTTMLCIPPPYNFITQEVSQANEFQPGSSVSAALPPLDAACCADNAAFTAEEADSSDVRGSSFPVPMEVRPDEHAIIRSSRPGSAGLGVQARSWDSVAFISM